MSGHNAVLAEAKQAIRRQQTAARDGLSLEERESRASQVCIHAWNFLQIRQADSLMSYVAHRSELDTRPLLMRAWEEHLTVFLPRVLPGDGVMALHRVSSWDELMPGAYGIMEPTGGSDEEPMDSESVPAVIFVPGIAFDRRGGRLGYGRGYYDRLRSATESAALARDKAPVWIGLAYGMQLVEEVPMEAHDAYMDYLITEDGIVHCRKENEA